MNLQCSAWPGIQPGTCWRLADRCGQRSSVMQVHDSLQEIHCTMLVLSIPLRLHFGSACKMDGQCPALQQYETCGALISLDTSRGKLCLSKGQS